MSFYSQHLFKSLGGKSAVEDVSLSISPGEAVGLFGPNGAGKTTSFLMMAGLLRPDEGHIFLQGQNVTSWPLYRKARLGLRYLPQETSIFRGLTVEDNLLAVIEILEPSRMKRREKLESLLDEFDLQRIRSSPARVLSGGERRRVEIARALVGDPSFLLLDEPLAGIDPKSVEDIARLIHHLTEQGIGILITDHNVKDMLPMVHRAYIMYHGKIFQEGSPQDIAQSPHVRQVYLGDSFFLR